MVGWTSRPPSPSRGRSTRPLIIPIPLVRVSTSSPGERGSRRDPRGLPGRGGRSGDRGAREHAAEAAEADRALDRHRGSEDLRPVDSQVDRPSTADIERTRLRVAWERSLTGEPRFPKASVLPPRRRDCGGSSRGVGQGGQQLVVEGDRLNRRRRSTPVSPVPLIVPVSSIRSSSGPSPARCWTWMTSSRTTSRVTTA